MRNMAYVKRLLWLLLIPLLTISDPIKAGELSQEHRRALTIECELRTGKGSGREFSNCRRKTREKLRAERDWANFGDLSNGRIETIKRACVGAIVAGLRAYDNCLNSKIGSAGPILPPNPPDKDRIYSLERLRLLVVVQDCNGGMSRKNFAVLRMIRHFQGHLPQSRYQVFDDNHPNLDDFQDVFGCRTRLQIMDMSHRVLPPIDVIIILTASQRSDGSMLLSALAVDRLYGASIGFVEEDSRRYPQMMDMEERLSQITKPIVRKLELKLSNWQDNRRVGIFIRLEGFKLNSQQEIVSSLERRLEGRSFMIEGGKTYFRFFFETKMDLTRLRHVFNGIVEEMGVSVLPQANEREFLVRKIGSR
jgi:hypothetical protein